MSETFGSLALRRFPRLIKAIERATGLGESHARCALVEYQVFGIASASETMEPVLQRIGGPLQAIRLGIHRRQGGL